jgi:hypothetical protein
MREMCHQVEGEGIIQQIRTLVLSSPRQKEAYARKTSKSLREGTQVLQDLRLSILPDMRRAG